jgi:putative transposase
MSKHLKLYLSETERKDLKGLSKRGKHGARTIKRARILLLADSSQGSALSYPEIMKAVGVCKATVSSTVRRGVLEGVGAALAEKPRPGRVPQLTGDLEARLITLACSEAPEGYARWTVRLLAQQLVVLGYVEDISKSSVFNMLKKTNSNLGKKPAGAFQKRAASLSRKWKMYLMSTPVLLMKSVRWFV